MGAHIGPPRSQTTSRRQSLGFRAATALFGHLGVEWNVMSLRDDERVALAEAIALHKRFRPLLHGGDTVRFDPLDGGGLAHGVYATDRSEALVCYSQVATSMALVPPLLRLPGLNPSQTYRVTRIPLPDDARERGRGRSEPAWIATGVTLDGATLAAIGVQLPVMNPESAFLLHLQAVALVASATLNR
jgi:alpha-galactosidase